MATYEIHPVATPNGGLKTMMDPDEGFSSQWNVPSGTALVPVGGQVYEGSVYDPGWSNVQAIAREAAGRDPVTGLMLNGNGGSKAAKVASAVGVLGGMTTALSLANKGGAPPEPGQEISASSVLGFLGGWQGIATGVLGAVGGVGGLLGMFGLKTPMQTPEGEGFIAPWTAEVLLPNGQYGQLGKGYPEINIAKSWSNYPGGQAVGSVVFFRLISPKNKVVYHNLNTGAWGSYNIKKHIVISSNPRLSNIRKLDNVYKRVTKTVSKYAPKKRGGQIVDARKFLSPAERKLLKAGGI